MVHPVDAHEASDFDYGFGVDSRCMVSRILLSACHCKGGGRTDHPIVGYGNDHIFSWRLDVTVHIVHLAFVFLPWANECDCSLNGDTAIETGIANDARCTLRNHGDDRCR